MHKSIYLFFIALVLISCYSKTKELALNIEQKKINFGTIKKGDIVDISYTIKNNSNDTVRIAQVNTSCGCTTTQYPKYILPRSVDSVTLKYNSISDSGMVEKVAVIETSEYPIFYSIYFNGKVK